MHFGCDLNVTTFPVLVPSTLLYALVEPFETSFSYLAIARSENMVAIHDNWRSALSPSLSISHSSFPHRKTWCGWWAIFGFAWNYMNLCACWNTESAVMKHFFGAQRFEIHSHLVESICRQNRKLWYIEQTRWDSRHKVVRVEYTIVFIMTNCIRCISGQYCRRRDTRLQ